MSKGHNTIVQTGREISINELNNICQAIEGFRNPDDSEPKTQPAGLTCRQGGRHE